MKIGIIAHNEFPISQPYHGGLEMITFLLVAELVRRGNAVTTLCAQGSTVKGEKVYYEPKQKNSENKELIELGSFSKSLVTFMKQDFDIIHNHSLHHQSIILGNYATAPFITTFHTPKFDNLHIAIDAISPNIRQYFTAVSLSLADLYKECLPEVDTVYNGINVDDWTCCQNTENYFSWSGRICPEKGLKEIIDLCESAHLALKIAGPISNLAYYQNEIMPRLKKSEYCEYVGHLTQKTLNPLVNQSSAYIFSSLWEEPYGLVIAEALASGVPVVANDVGAVSEIITEECGALFTISSADSFLFAIANALNMNKIDCRNRALNFCSHHQMVDDYEQLYNKRIEPKTI